MTPLEQLAVLKAIGKVATDREKEVKAECDAEFFEQYDQMGIKKKELRLGGQKMGEYIINMAKPEFVVSNKEEFDDFALCNGLASVKRSIDPWMVEKVIGILEDHLDPEALSQFIHEEVEYNSDWQKAMVLVDGEVVLDGSNHIVPGVSYIGERPKNTQIRNFKPEIVISTVQRLGGVDQLLLGDSNE